MQKESLVLDSTWQFKEFPESARRMRDLDSGHWLDATVPSSIYTCLQQAGLVSIPELPSDWTDIQWVDQKNWVFRKEFDIPKTLLEKEQIEIIFDGLDTVAHIWLNDKLIGKTDNMFIPHRFDIKPYLKKTRNQLTIKFVSALHHADRLQDRYGKLGRHPLRNPCSVYIRKAAYQFGSDFGPALTGCGIFRPVRIEGHNTAKIENLHLRTIDCSQYDADIRVALELKRMNNDNIKSTITITGGGLNLKQELLFNENDTTASTVLHMDRPFLWWPQGYGVPHLYHVKVDLLTDDGTLLDTVCQDFGIRTLHIDRSSEKTECVVNGQPISLKGTGWMPLSPFPGTRTDYDNLLKKAQSCHINLLCVGAGGTYENDTFYTLCDQMGILVWQDFVFDSAYYPDRQWFTDSVKDEATAVIKQLRNHACLALWCGNNNIDHLHKCRKLGKGRKFYGKSIYHKLLPALINELDPDRQYRPTRSSDTIENQSLVSHAPDILSPPCQSTLSTQRCFKDSFKMLEKLTCNHSPLQTIAQYQVVEFSPPINLTGYIWQSQVVQARRIQNAVEKVRSVNHSGCMLGALNSFALSVNGAMLDAQTQPKALYYYARRFFAPVLVTLFTEEQSGSIRAFVVNDTASPVTGVLSCRMIATHGEILDTTEIPLRVSPFSKAAAINLPKSLSTPDDPTRAFLSVSIKNNDKSIATNAYFFCRDKHFQWPIADIDLQISSNDEQNAWDVTLTSEVPVRDIQIIPPQPADISDNFLTLLPNQPKKIRIVYHDSFPPVRTPLEIFSTNQACNPD
ncbi:MAG: beta-mannosidase [Planctomycetota bacterium]|jgi:beta-mannosidase